MDDQSILHRIQHLVDEEHRLDSQTSRSPEDHERHRSARPVLGPPAPVAGPAEIRGRSQ
jgi:hypothetical protein